MRFCRFDYEYYVEVESGIGFSEEAREQLRQLLFNLESMCRDLVVLPAVWCDLLTAGPWEVRVNVPMGAVTIGVRGTPRALFSLNTGAMKSPGPLGKNIEGAINQVIGMLNSVRTEHLIAYVERDRLPEYILDAEDREMHGLDSYRQHGRWYE